MIGAASAERHDVVDVVTRAFAAMGAIHRTRIGLLELVFCFGASRVCRLAEQGRLQKYKECLIMGEWTSKLSFFGWSKKAA